MEQKGTGDDGNEGVRRGRNKMREVQEEWKKTAEDDRENEGRVRRKREEMKGESNKGDESKAGERRKIT